MAEPQQPRKLAISHILAVGAGNALSFYDFVTYAFFAIQIGQTFFPFHDSTTSLLASLATFGVGFFARPVGALVIGRYADRHGRKPAMIFSFALMGVSILGMALTPGYRTLGIAAPIIAIVFRLLQGFALGGEVGPATAWLIEAAPPLKRGFYASISYATQDGGVLVAGLVGTLLAALMPATMLADYGWRIAFALGASIVPFGLLLRRRLAETLATEEQAKPAPLRPFLRVALLGLLMLATATVCNYVIDYMTTYAGHTLAMPPVAAFSATIVIGLCNVSCDLLSGWLSDKYGRKPLMLIFYPLLLVIVVPAFMVVVQSRSVPMLLLASALFASLQCLASGPILTTITESIPASVRAGAVGTIYALSITIFGGTTQLVVAWLTDRTHNPLVPGYYMMAFIALGLCGMMAMRETAPIKNLPSP